MSSAVLQGKYSSLESEHKRQVALKKKLRQYGTTLRQRIVEMAGEQAEAKRFFHSHHSYSHEIPRENNLTRRWRQTLHAEAPRFTQSHHSYMHDIPRENDPARTRRQTLQGQGNRRTSFLNPSDSLAPLDESAAHNRRTSFSVGGNRPASAVFLSNSSRHGSGSPATLGVGIQSAAVSRRTSRTSFSFGSSQRASSLFLGNSSKLGISASVGSNQSTGENESTDFSVVGDGGFNPKPQADTLAEEVDIGDFINTMQSDEVEITHLYQVFCDFDSAGNGELGLEDFCEAYAVIDESMPLEEVKILFDEADYDGSGSIDFGEFLRLATTPQIKLQAMKQRDIRDSSGLVQIEPTRGPFFNGT